MIKLSIQDIAGITNGVLTCSHDVFIEHLLVDSRKLTVAAGTLFFALPGVHHDGHRFIHDMYQKGVRNFIVSELPENSQQYPDSNFLVVPDTLEALQSIASFVRKKFIKPLISITGSNGKTVVKEWLSQVLSGDKKVVRSPRSYNSQVGVPLSLWLLDNSYDIGLIEAGISLPGEMQRLSSIVTPDIGIFTNIGEAHQENFDSISHKVREKLTLFSNTPCIIYCKDHIEIQKEIEANPDFKKKKFIRWSEKSDAELKIIKKTTDNGRTLIEGIYNKRSVRIQIPFSDKASVENAIHIWCLLIHLDYPDNTIEELAIKLEPVGMRLELIKGINNCTIINDSYNSDLGSFTIALDFLFSQKQHKKKTLILSDILQSGRDDNDLYSEVAKLVHEKKLSKIIGIGDSISQHANLFSMEKEFYNSTEQFLSSGSIEKIADETILLKGARKFAFEKILYSLEMQIHQTQLEINLDALAHNLTFYRSKLQPKTKTMVVVKASSYGTGSFEIANMLQFQRVDSLAVAFTDEGVTMRQGGIALPIMVMNPESNTLETILQYNLEPEIYSFNLLENFATTVRRNGLSNYPVHIKLDTGMNRLGFLQDEIPDLTNVIAIHPEIRIKSVFSHLAASGDKNHDVFTHHQISQFKMMSETLIASLDYPVLRHILNSAGIERFPDAQFDMVRLGIGLYGISSENQEKLANVCTLTSRVSQLKRVRVGDTIGYNRSSMAEDEMEIAIIPVGYADGLSRKLGNGAGNFIINRTRVPIVGEVCMDMCTVNVSGMDVSVGDEVEILGENNPVTELAKKLNTIPYEILSGISHRVKRVYYQEG